jgi:hypothetical protein
MLDRFNSHGRSLPFDYAFGFAQGKLFRCARDDIVCVALLLRNCSLRQAQDMQDESGRTDKSEWAALRSLVLLQRNLKGESGGSGLLFAGRA